MPSTDPNKYILHPLEPLTVPEALLTAFCGLLVVFMMLAMLMVVIYVISWVVQQIESKRKPVAAPAKAAPKPAAPKPAAAPAQDESELVAVMMAAVAEESGMPMGSFQITNIAPAVAAAPAAAIPAPVAAPAPAPAPVAAAPTAAAPAAGETAVKSPMPGNIFKVAPLFQPLCRNCIATPDARKKRGPPSGGPHSVYILSPCPWRRSRWCRTCLWPPFLPAPAAPR